MLGRYSPLRPLERKLMFHPTTAAPAVAVPAQKFESVRIPVSDTERLHAVYLEHPSPQAVLLYCHGNAGNIADRLPRLEHLRANYSLTVLGFDYRGYGASDGRPDEQHMYEDARAARNWLARRAGVGRGRVVLLGRSLGGAVAVELAATDGARGLILENTFSSMPEVGQKHLKFLPVSMIVTQRFDSAQKIPNYKGPLLQLHGTDDEVVPFVLGEKLFAAAGSESKQFCRATGGHNDPPPDDYNRRLGHFLHSLEPPPRAEFAGETPVVHEPEFNCHPASRSVF